MIRTNVEISDGAASTTRTRIPSPMRRFMLSSVSAGVSFPIASSSSSGSSMIRIPKYAGWYGHAIRKTLSDGGTGGAIFSSIAIPR